MAYLTDIEIAQANEMQKITEVAKTAGIPEDCLELLLDFKTSEIIKSFSFVSCMLRLS